MIIDMHIHVFADQLAPRALRKLEAVSGICPTTDLTEADTREKLPRWGVDLAVVQPVATKPSQQHTINTWAASLQRGRLVSYGTLYAPDPSALDAVDEIAELGLKGVKLHPDYQKFEVDDESILPLYAKMAEAGLPVLFHAGWDPISPDQIHCTPAMISRLHEKMPELTIIAAHLGGNRMPDEVERRLVGQDVYLDVSLAPSFCEFAQFERIVKGHGPSRILFATDTPWSSAPETEEWVRRLDIPEEDKERIFWRNAAGLLGLSEEEIAQRSGIES